MKGRQGDSGYLGLLYLAAGLLLCCPVVTFAQARKRAAGVPLSKDQQIRAQLTKAWTAFYAGKVDEAAKLAAPLTKLTHRQYRLVTAEASHIQARSLWANGSRTNQVRAKRMWKIIEKRSTQTATQTRKKIVTALELEAAKKPAKRDEAIGILEKILKDRRMSIATPEAGLDLARLQVSARRFDDAEKTLKSVLKLLGDKDNLTRMELPDDSLAAPYIAAARGALNRLKFERNAGREEFEAAEKLRRQKKWIPACQAYQGVAKDFADTDYAPRSELAMGYCFIGLKRVEQALVHWGKFTKAQPAGPWRAQAYVATIDIYIEDKLDLPQAGKCATAARNALPAALDNKKAVESWKPLVFDLHLRVGMVAFCRNQGAIAAKAFGAAKNLTRDKAVRESLDVLAAAAKTGRPIIPKDVAGRKAGKIKPLTAAATPADRAALALSLGMIYHITRRHDQADAFFTRVVGAPASKGKRAVRPMRGATTPQLAFAIFCKGAILQARNKIPEAREHFKTSIKVFREGTWHDESLFRVARIIQKQADAKIAKANAQAASGEQRRTTKLATKIKTQAREEVHVYWQELIDRYPKSPRCEQAIYGDGVFLCELAEAAAPAQSTKMWKDAMFMLARFCELYPRSPWAGDAYVRQMDIALERMFDLELTTAVAKKGVIWAKWLTNNKSDLPEAPKLPPWCLVEMYPTYASLHPVLYECYLRVGLAAYFDGRTDDAIAAITAAGPQRVPDDPQKRVDYGKIGLNCLLRLIRSGKPLTQKRALDDAKTDAERLGVRLGDVYLAVIRPDRAEAVFRQVIAISSNSAVEGYALLQLAVALDRQKGKRPEALDVLRQLSTQRYAKTYWGPYGMFRLALFTHNQSQNSKEAMPLYKKMFTRYPRHPMAYSARLCYALDAIAVGNIKEASRSVAEFLKKHTNSPHASYLRERLQALLATKENVQ